MAQTSQTGNVFLDILNNHGDTLQQLALLAYLSKGDEAKPFLQATTAAKVNVDERQMDYLVITLSSYGIRSH